MLCRLAAILTAVRHFESKSTSDVLYCNGADFETALWLVDQSAKNALEVFKQLEGKYKKGNSKKEAFFSVMPETFVLSEVTNLYADLNIKKRTVNRYVQQLMNEGQLECLSYAVYRKVPTKN
jgi:hypothetical protein